MTGGRFGAFSWGVLAYSLLVILWGYFLRISESGDGCGTDWPLCHGAVVPLQSEFPTWVEFIHRASSGIVLLLVLILTVWAFRSFPRGHALRKGAGAALFFTVSESLFGAMLVVFGLVAADVSTARILVRPFHVTNTFLLMAALGLTAWWAATGIHRIPLPGRGQLRLVVPGILGILALAWTGSWTGLAGTAFPVSTVAEGLGQYLAPGHILIYLRMTHPAVAVIAVVLLLRIAGQVFRTLPDPTSRRLAAAVGIFAASQLVLGPLTIFLLHPVGLRLLHLLLADLLWLALLFLASTVFEHGPEPSPSSSPGQRDGMPQGRAKAF